MTSPADEHRVTEEPPRVDPEGAGYIPEAADPNRMGEPDTPPGARPRVPFVEPLPPTDIVTEARARGRADGGSGAVDVWMFDENHTLPYLERLPTRCDSALGERARQRDEVIRTTLNAERDRANQESRNTALRRDDRARVDRTFREATDRAQRALRRLDRMATFESWRRETRHLIEFTRATRDLAMENTDPDAPRDADAHPAEEGRTDGVDEPTRSVDPQAGNADRVRPADHDDTSLDPYDGSPNVALDELVNAPWEGNSPSPLRPGVQRLALLALIMIDIPIQFLVFRNFQTNTSEGFAETVLITLPTSVVMILLPHFAGLLFRSRHGTGREVTRTVLAAVLLVPWIGLGVILGILRAHVLSVPQENARGNTTSVTDVAQRLGVTPTTISIMFVTILMLTGGIALLLGLAHRHPVLAAFETAQQERQESQELQGWTEPEFAEQPMVTLTEEEAQAREDRADEALRLAFIDAEYAYLDGLAEGMHDPAATEAIGRLARRRTLARQSQQPEGEE